MKYKKMLMICAAAVFCMMFQTQPVCAKNGISQTRTNGQMQKYEMVENASAQALEGTPQTTDDELGSEQVTDVPSGDGNVVTDPTSGEQNDSLGEDSVSENAQEENQQGENQSGENQQGNPEEDDPSKEEPEEETEKEETNKEEPEKSDEEEPEKEEPVKVKPEKKIPIPQKVTGLHTTCLSDKKVLLEWDATAHACKYRIYRKKGTESYKELAETSAVSYTDPAADYGNIFQYKIIPVNKNGKAGKAATIRLSHTQAVNIKTQKYTYQQMAADMKELEKQYSNYCELTPIGTSVKGRKIYDFAIGNPDAEESLLVVSTLHAREYICSTVLMREIEYYLKNYNRSLDGTTPAKVLKNMQIHYIVMANPDGVMISQTKPKLTRWKANFRGVDLNSNFPANKFIVRGRAGAEGYSGLHALSEPESQAVATLTTNLQREQHLLGVVNYHAMGQIVFGDCADAKIKKNTHMMYRLARELTGYADSGGYSSPKSVADGSYREYVMYILGIPSITLEVGSTYAPCSFLEYDSAFRKNKLVVLKIAEAL